jgi:type IV pilus assembly protein PilM
MLTLTKKRVLPIGLYLGPRTATLVQLTGGPGHLQVHAMAQGELPVNETAPLEQQDRDVAAAVRKLIADHKFRGRLVVSCLGSQELFVQNVRVPKLPPGELEKVVRWEAEERLPYPVAEAELRHLLAGEVRQDANLKQEVILLACHQGVIKRHIALLELAGPVPTAIDVEPCALMRCLASADALAAADSRRAYIHFGDKSTTVIFAEGEQILFLKFISGGSYHLDLAVARNLNIPLREAAKMRSVVNAAPALDKNDEVHRSIIEAVRGPLETTCGEVELCLRYHKVTFRGKPIEKIVVTGDEACPWLEAYLTSRFGTPCEIGKSFTRLQGPIPASQRGRPGVWATAMGLALK